MLYPPVFGILGELRVRGVEGDVRVGGHRRRSLLAYLLVHAGQRVTVDRICEDIWESSPPPGAPATVRTYVSQFRKFAARGGGLTVQSGGTGYLVQLDRSDLDAARFEDLVDASRSAAFAERIANFDEALALWRGAALAEFTGSPWADDEARRLEVLRLQVEHDRFAAMFEVGRTSECLADLERAVAESPLDERFAELLSLARYRTGRPSEALGVLSGLRRRLADELGVDPGPEIVDLERRILDRDPTLDARSSQPSAPYVEVPAGELPSGTVTFLFTDIEGSTRLLDVLGARSYAQVLDAHREAMSSAVREHDGCVLGFEGDAMFAVFERARDAIDGALEAQHLLADCPWPNGIEVRVRMGVHTGDAILVDGGYVGTTVHIAARTCAVAHGGQVVVSDAGLALAPAADVLDLGIHRLRDVDRPMRLYQLVEDGLPASFPPLSTAAYVPQNLPVSVDEFVGRASDEQSVRGALGEHRLVTIVGPGGVGKTRLAVEAAGSVLPQFAGGVWLVDLATITDADGLSATVASTLGVRERPGADLEDVIADAFSEGPTLVVMDNCEHVIDAAADLIGRLVARCPTMTILATSREPLQIKGERIVDLFPLGLGDTADLSDAEQLFVVRAAAATTALDVERCRPLVAQICRDLDGLPLAIELAASRLRGLSLQDVAQRLDDRFSLLRSHRRGELPRHQTLEAVVGWSHEALSPADRALFNRLAVFAGTFTVDVASTVVAGEGIESVDVADGLARLVDKSLVARVQDAELSRYRMLETLRQYGRARLVETGSLVAAQKGLLSWALDVVTRLEHAMRTPDQDAAIQETLPEIPNLRVAMDYALERGDRVAALRIVSMVPLGKPTDRAERISALIETLDDAPRRHVADACMATGNLALERGDYQAVLESYTRAFELYTELGDERQASWARFFSAFASLGLEDFAQAREVVERAKESFDELGDDFGRAYAMWLASQLTDDLARGKRLAVESERLYRRLGAPFGLGHVLEGLALIALQAGTSAEARLPLSEALDIFVDGNHAGCVAHCLDAIAAYAAVAASASATAELLGAADALRTLSGHGHRPWELRGNRAASAALADADDSDGLEACIARGRQHDLSSANALARAILRAEASGPSMAR